MIASSLDARRELETISDRPVATALAPHLAKLTSLAKLYLGSNYIRVAGATALAPHLAKLTSLAELNLSSNRIGFFTIDQLRWILRKVECLLLE